MKKLEDIFQRFVSFVGRADCGAFFSDSCNSMRALWTRLLDHGLVSWEYGYATHPLNNFCKDIIFIPDFKADLWRSLFLLKGIKNKGMVGKIFRVLSSELYGK